MARLLVLTTLFMLLVGCQTTNEIETANVIMTSMPLRESADCLGRFSAHDLPYTTTATLPIQMFDSNGSGLAVNDLDNDGDLDLVFANIRGPNSVLWNQGDLQFEPQELDFGGSRAVTTIDMDGDGLHDLFFATRNGSVAQLRNVDGRGLFVLEPLVGVDHPAWSMTWADLDCDGDLDLVTGSYDAAHEKDMGNSFMFSQGGGVFIYENQDGEFAATRLTDEAQALTLYLLDLDKDGQDEILVGNDFALRDEVWQKTDSGWENSAPFTVTTHSTMSFDAGDIDNDGYRELFATDMKPHANDEATQSAWAPVIASMMDDPHVEGDPQIMENVLQVRGSSSSFENIAVKLGLDATGWSWSTKFGDLNNDGWLDMYVVNGMIAEELFGHLMNDQLVEANQAFINDGSGGLLPISADWGLDGTRSGRSMSMADLDNDGDLDIVVNNLQAPAQIFENQLCAGASLQVELVWPESGNNRAVGAELVLVTSNGRYLRDVRATSGYLSGDPARVHFGFPVDSELQRLEILWPDGAMSTVESPRANKLLYVERPNSVVR